MATTRIVKYIEIGPKELQNDDTNMFTKPTLKGCSLQKMRILNFKLVEMSLSIFHKAVASVVPSPS